VYLEKNILIFFRIVEP